MKKKKKNLFDYLNIIFMTLFCIVIVFPFWDVIVRSISSAKTADALELLLWPKELSLDAYMYVFRDAALTRALLVTVARTVLGTVFTLVLTMMLAYPLSNRNLPFRGTITTILIITMFFGGGLIPGYLNLRNLGLTDTFWVYILPGGVGVYNATLMRNFIMSLDRGLEEAALIDGASYMKILFKIIFPVSKPIVATVALWLSVGHWNSWFDTLVYTRKEGLRTLQFLLHKMQNLTSTENEEMMLYMMNNPNIKITSTNVRMATTVITLLPIMCVYPYVQKYFVKGIMAGSLKG